VKWSRRRERNVLANGCCQETRRKVIGSHRDPCTGVWWAARCGATGKDLDNDHAAAAARAWRTMIGRGARIGCVVRCWRIDLRHWGGDQVLGARDIGFAAGAGQQSVVADAMKPLRQNVEQEAPDELVVRYRGCPLRR
jgi:hypothetical protein